MTPTISRINLLMFESIPHFPYTRNYPIKTKIICIKETKTLERIKRTLFKTKKKKFYIVVFKRFINRHNHFLLQNVKKIERVAAKILKTERFPLTTQIVEHRNILPNIASSVEYISILSMNVPSNR